MKIQSMIFESTVNVTEAQANLPKLIRRDSFAIARHGKVVGVFLSRDRIEALVESMELLSNPDFAPALKEYQSGKMKFHDAAKLDREMSA
jgi:antitoxin (DNA-binding transcriptional repressor) of toxin-antitoxin stability system